MIKNLPFAALFSNKFGFCFQCVYCEPTKQCEDGSVVKKTLQKACKEQEWKVGQCIGKLPLTAVEDPV